MNMKRIVLFLSFALLAATLSAQTPYVPSPENLAAREKFSQDRFGVFIHWGIYSMLADGEWIMNNNDIPYEEYKNFASGFYPSKFDAREWVRTFKAAGAKYITITSRHHDGFSIFDTKASDYSVMNTPFRRDILRELADACRKEGLKIGFYYSLLDWTREDYPWQAMGKEHNGRGYGRDPAKQDYGSYLSFMKAQLSELLTNYGPVNCIWFDGEWATRGVSFDWRLGEIYRHIHAIRPDCLIVNNHHHLAVSEEDVQTFEKDLPGESKSGFTRGQKISTDVPLETCDTMGESWGYKIAEAGRWKTPEALVKMLVGAAGKGANLLLNVGPRADGRLPEEALVRLAFFGTWLGEYGETVYGTAAGPVKSGENVISTRKGDEIYVHVFDANLKELTCTLREKVTDVTAFAGGGKLSFLQTPDSTVRVTLPASDAFDRVIRLKVN